MNVIDFLFVLIGTVAAILGVYYSSRARTPWRHSSRGVWRILRIVIGLSGIAFFMAYRWFRALPAWPFHMALACLMILLAVTAYLDYKSEPVA
jgi:hypothetical protein